MISLDELRELERKATPGPWEEYSAMCCPDMGGVSGTKSAVCSDTRYSRGHPMIIEDATLIAAMRNNIVELIDAYEREKDRTACWCPDGHHNYRACRTWICGRCREYNISNRRPRVHAGFLPLCRGCTEVLFSTPLFTNKFQPEYIKNSLWEHFDAPEADGVFMCGKEGFDALRGMKND